MSTRRSPLQATAIGTLKIDMRDILSKGYQYGMKMHGTLAFNGHEHALCEFNPDYMGLVSRRKVGGLWKYVNQEVTIDWQSRQYGSKDSYFLCPVCGKRTMVLYHRGTSLICRKCCALTQKLKCAPYDFMPTEHVGRGYGHS